VTDHSPHATYARGASIVFLGKKYCILVWYYASRSHLTKQKLYCHILGQFLEKQQEFAFFGPSCITYNLRQNSRNYKRGSTTLYCEQENRLGYAIAQNEGKTYAVKTSVRRRQKNIDSSSKSNPLRRRRKKQSQRTFNTNSCDLLTAITHTEILVAYLW